MQNLKSWASREVRSRNRSNDLWRLGRFAGMVSILIVASCGGSEPARLEVLLDEGAVEFPAVVRAADFAGPVAATGGYHLIVWKNGTAADKALFRAEVSDLEFLDALEALGAIPGDALSLETWDDRFDEGSWRPDQVVGSGFEMRFGGHRANIPEWRSGCVACLYSCPGSKIGNANYTVRDYVRESTRFSVKEGVLPKDGSRVTVRVELVRP